MKHGFWYSLKLEHLQRWMIDDVDDIYMYYGKLDRESFNPYYDDVSNPF